MPESVTVNADTLAKDKYKSKTPLEAEKLRNLEAEADTAEVMETGQDNEEKGKKVVAQVESINETARQQKVDEFLSALQEKKKFQASYKELLAQTLRDYLKMLDFPFGWEAHIVITDGSPIRIKGSPFRTQNGILLIVTTPDGRVFHQGMLTTNDPVLDYAAVMNLAIQTENQFDRERGQLLSVGRQRTNLPEKVEKVTVDKVSKGGIILDG